MIGRFRGFMLWPYSSWILLNLNFRFGSKPRHGNAPWHRASMLAFVLSFAFGRAAYADDKVVPGWDPTMFRDASTIKIMTTEPDV